MKKIICFSMALFLLFVGISPLVNQTKAHARPITDQTPPASGTARPVGPILERESELELLPSGCNCIAASRKRSYRPMTPFKIIPVGVQDVPTPDCEGLVDDILRKLDEIGLEIDKLERALARAAGVADDALSSPVLRRTFRSTMREIAARAARTGGRRLFLSSLGVLGIIYDLIQTMEFFDVSVENFIREDLLANNPEMTEDQAREQAETLSDVISHHQMAILNGFPGGGFAGLYHFIELHSEQRSCPLHRRAAGKPTGPFRPSPNPGRGRSGGVGSNRRTPVGTVGIGCRIFGPIGIDPITGFIIWGWYTIPC